MMQESIIPKIRQETKTVKITFELKKDLQEHEVVCPNCHGTGLEIDDNIYGIHGDTTHVGVHFPYKNQSLTFCRRCYNGVLHKCPGCGALIGKKGCSCGYASEQRRAKWDKETLEAWIKAEKIPMEDAVKCYDCLYIDNLDKYVFGSDELKEVVEDYLSEFEEAKLSDLRVYGTTERNISLDAADIIETACEELHDEAIEQCDEKSLQKALDDWCQMQGGTTTYYPYYKVGVLLKPVVEG